MKNRCCFCRGVAGSRRTSRAEDRRRARPTGTRWPPTALHVHAKADVTQGHHAQAPESWHVVSGVSGQPPKQPGLGEAGPQDAGRISGEEAQRQRAPFQRLSREAQDWPAGQQSDPAGTFRDRRGLKGNEGADADGTRDEQAPSDGRRSKRRGPGVGGRGLCKSGIQNPPDWAGRGSSSGGMFCSFTRHTLARSPPCSRSLHRPLGDKANRRPGRRRATPRASSRKSLCPTQWRWDTCLPCRPTIRCRHADGPAGGRLNRTFFTRTRPAHVRRPPGRPRPGSATRLPPRPLVARLSERPD